MCVLIALVALPLVFGIVGANPVYGMRTSVTLSSPAAWRAANTFAGLAFLVAAGTSAALLWLVPWASRTWVAVALFTAPVVLALAVSIVHANTLG
jgi:uncharacterized membrane protein